MSQDLHSPSAWPLPLFDRASASKRARLAEDAWNMRDPEKVATGYTIDRYWRNRSQFVSGWDAIVEFFGLDVPGLSDFEF